MERGAFLVEGVACKGPEVSCTSWSFPLTDKASLSYLLVKGVHPASGKVSSDGGGDNHTTQDLEEPPWPPPGARQMASARDQPLPPGPGVQLPQVPADRIETPACSFVKATCVLTNDILIFKC